MDITWCAVYNNDRDIYLGLYAPRDFLKKLKDIYENWILNINTRNQKCMENNIGQSLIFSKREHDVGHPLCDDRRGLSL